MKYPSMLTITFLTFILFLTACSGPSVATNNRPQFVSSTPENGATDVGTNTTLRWTFTDPENDALTYEVFFGESKMNTKLVYKGLNNFHREELEPSKTYYWKVIANDGNNKTDSDWLSFSTKKINRAPKKPELLSPAPSSGNVDYKQVVFQWRCTDPDQDPLKFELYLDGSFLATTTNYQYTKYNLQPSKTYTWFVKAFDGEYTIQSDPATFTTAQVGQNSAPYVPKVISPPDGAQSVNIPVTLEWECSDPDGDSLNFEVYLNEVKKTDTNQSRFVLSDLSPNKTYSWYIKASDGTNLTVGPKWTFTTKGLANSAPSMPTNPSPENNASVFETDVLLSWVSSDPDEDLLFYDLYFGEGSNPPLIRQNLSSSNMLIQNLEKNKKYYWKVVAKDGNTSTEGPVWNFYTGVQTTYSKLLALCEDGIYQIDFTQEPASDTKISTITGNDFFYYEENIFVIGNEFSIISESGVATASFAGNSIWVDALVPIQKIVAGEVFACITNDATLLILGISDQSVDQRSSIPLNEPSSLFILGQYIYVCDNDGLKKYDALDPSNPVLKNSFSCRAKDVYVVDNMVYLLSDSKVYRLGSNDLSEIKSTSLINGKRIYFDSGFVYVLSDQKLVKYDEELSKLKEIDLNAHSIVVSGSYIYVATQQGIQVFDINLEQSKSLDLMGIREILLLR